MTDIIQKVKNLSIGFRSKKGDEILILKNITTNIKKGETVGIVGEIWFWKKHISISNDGICQTWTLYDWRRMSV